MAHGSSAVLARAARGAGGSPVTALPPSVEARRARSERAHVALGPPRNEPLLARSTRAVLRFRRSTLAVWFVLLLAGAAASSRLSPLLSNGFGVPGTDSARAA